MTTDPADITRLDVSFPSDGETCAAWLYLPPGDGPRPVIVMAHGLGAVREMRLDAFAERFAARGYACLVFDYRHFGASSGRPRQLLSISRQLEDWTAAVAYARTRSDLDPDRVVVWGTSFSGGHAIVTAANDPRLAAAVAQCPFTDGLASLRAIPVGTVAKISARALRDVAAAARHRDPVMIDTAGRAGDTALMTAADVVDGYLPLAANAPTFVNEVAARVGLTIGLHAPGRSAAKVRVPILYCVCDDDTVAPAAATLRHAATSPRGEIRRYPAGHFDIYVGDDFEAVVADQIEFLARHVPVGTG